jgi:anti-sigma-K factor RskA
MNEHLEPEIFDAYLDGELPARKRRRVQQHLSQCLACRRQIERLELQGALLRQVLEQRAAEQDFSRLHQQVMEKIRIQRPLPFGERWRSWWENLFAGRRLALALSAAVLFLVVLGFMWLAPRKSPLPELTPPEPPLVQAQAEPSALIDHLEYTGQRSMIYTVSRNNTTVIWLVDFDRAAKDRPQGEDL